MASPPSPPLFFYTYNIHNTHWPWPLQSELTLSSSSVACSVCDCGVSVVYAWNAGSVGELNMSMFTEKERKKTNPMCFIYLHVYKIHIVTWLRVYKIENEHNRCPSRAPRHSTDHTISRCPTNPKGLLIHHSNTYTV